MHAKVAIIVVNWRVRELLRACLLSVLEHGGFDSGSYELIVVDNDSADGSVEMVREQFPQVRLVANTKNVGFGAANNQALELTDAEWIVLLNPDTLVEGAALARMLALLQAQPEVALVGCRLLNRDGSLQRWTAGTFPTLRNVASHYLFGDRLLPRAWRPRSLYLDRDAGTGSDVDWVSGACMAIRRTALQGQLLFDPRFFMYAEDMELCYRLKASGWRVRYEPSVSIVHYQGASLQQQQADIMLSSLNGPRRFFRMMHGARATRWLDVLTVCGFAMRTGLYALAGIAGGGPVYRQRAASSRRYLGLSLAVFREGRREP
jgi:GT2 family glycosyltransferase